MMKVNTPSSELCKKRGISIDIPQVKGDQISNYALRLLYKSSPRSLNPFMLPYMAA